MTSPRSSCWLRLAIAGAAALLCGCFEGGPDDAGSFCHGEPDGTSCNDGSPCTTGDVCGLGVCRGRPLADGSPCNDGSLCTSGDRCVAGLCQGDQEDCTALDGACARGTCDPATGECRVDPLNEGQPCDDGQACTEGDTCAAGSCLGVLKDCSYLDQECQTGACSPATGACVAAAKAEGAECDDGDPCTLGDACTGGSCVGLPLDCAELDDDCLVGSCVEGACVAEALADGTPCDDGQLCTEGDACAAGSCHGARKDCSHLDQECEAGTCAPATGVCVAVPRGEGEECDDGDPCTLGDACTGVSCAGQPLDCSALDDQCLAGRCVEGACAAEQVEDDTPCDDGVACTGGDSCAAGLCAGLINLCGGCQELVEGELCDDGIACTTGDTCVAHGEILACEGRALDCSDLDDACNRGRCEPARGECVAVPVAAGTLCDDGDSCTGGDACEFGECRGRATDCAHLDTACTVGRCDPESGGCTFAAVADGMPCDDADPCTGGDSCTGGACTGPVALCGACQGLAAGDPCEDGSACTTEDTCLAAGELLVCTGRRTDCSVLDDPCQVGTCAPATGECRTVPRPDGRRCDDGEPCTQGDTCIAGACHGETIQLCGDSAQLCEAPSANDDVPSAYSLPLGGEITLLGWIDPPGDQDWYEVELRAGQILTAEVRSHCGSALDSILAVLPPASESPLAYDDDSGPGAWSTIDGTEILADGKYYVGVSAYVASGAGTYLLTIAAAFPPPCAADADCGCPELVCAADGPRAGECVPAMPAEIEPNDSAAAAMTVEVGGTLLGGFEAAGSEDWYSVRLEAGVPVAVATAPFCGELVDPAISLRAADGRAVLAADSDSAGDGHARIAGFVAPQTATYSILVTEERLATGHYLLTVEDLRCLVDADCSCPDQSCPSDGVTPMACGPANPVEQHLEGGAATLAPGRRSYSAIDLPYEVDTFAVELGAGVYDIITDSYCGAGVDTMLQVKDDLGELLAVDDDSGPGFFAAVAGLVVGAATTLQIEVSASGPEVGPYILLVQPAGGP